MATLRGTQRLASAGRALDRVQSGLTLVDTVLKIGEGAGLPLIPAVCSAARGVLQVVQASQTLINDALSAVQRTVDVLELLEQRPLVRLVARHALPTVFDPIAERIELVLAILRRGDRREQEGDGHPDCEPERPRARGDDRRYLVRLSGGARTRPTRETRTGRETRDRGRIGIELDWILIV